MKIIDIDLTPEQYHQPEQRQQTVARALNVPDADIAGMAVVRRSIDCRRRNVMYHTTVQVRMKDEPELVAQQPNATYRDCHAAPPVVIVGAGPAGLFAALKALELGLKPIIVERGKPVSDRKYDIAAITRQKYVNPDSNWCFGEGGAGTYSDGKLYTRSTKRGDIGAVLRTFVAHGADPDIMLDAHAHIGTDRLSAIIASMRETIEGHGGEYHFNTRVTDLLVRDGVVYGVATTAGNIEGRAVILATGHSARDIYQLFHTHGWFLEAKPFALGVRVEHPQQLINEIQYHGRDYSTFLPPAAYSLTTQVSSSNQAIKQSRNPHGVFSFCMCPGGVIVPAATADGQQVVNGMSNSRRNSPFANSGIAVTVSLDDVPDKDVFALLRFQQEVERQTFHAAGDAINAPAQRLTDFLQRRPSASLNPSGYMGQCINSPLHELLPPFVVDALIQGFRDFDRKMRGFVTDQASLLAVESRTSSPVRIPRDKVSLQHPQLQGLFPCGEGAGYAGGIVSSAMDGIRCMEECARLFVSSR
ncbi:MAG: FAD-binding protein [Bacteroidales bacterium]|nr:FAD-binding protein [Bacteroidales bacterium]